MAVIADLTDARAKVIYISIPCVAVSGTHNTYGADANKVARQFHFDKSRFQNIGQITIETLLAVNNIANTAYLRLYNITDAGVVAGSEINTNSAARILVESGDIKANLPSANRIYRAETYVAPAGTYYNTQPIAWLKIECR